MDLQLNAHVIKAEGLGKEYVIGGRQKVHATFYDMLGSGLTAPLRRLRKLRGQVEVEERFWALRDVSFEVSQGEVVGIIGRNGAGKSTLLKLLSRITAPTEGRAEIRGRVASLLEVGTGFHPELTGLENIYLNGAILGMSRAEIRRKFDEIVGFAEIDEFLETPVKRYSSGMYVRLAFAVAAHLEPDILLVDEVLAVGDAKFQKKSLGRMRKTAQSGRTVFFVSHNIGSIQALCSKCMLLDGGRLSLYDDTSRVIANYFDAGDFTEVYERPQTSGQKHATIVRAAVRRRSTPDRHPEPALYLELDVWTDKATATDIEVRLKDSMGIPVAFGSVGALAPGRPIQLREGPNRVLLKIGLRSLALGAYSISLDLSNPYIEYYDRAEDCLNLHIEESFFDGATPYMLHQNRGFGSSRINVEQVNN